MSLTSHAAGRLGRLYRSVLDRTRQRHNRSAGGPRAALAPPRPCVLEQLEPRCLLDGAAGPQVVGHWPDGLASLADHLDLTFNTPIDPATVSADDIRITPLTTFRQGGYDTAGTAQNVAVSGTLAYVADGGSGLQILDVSNPAAPVRLGGYDTTGEARDVAVSGTLAYVADYSSGLQILDVSNPAAPVRLGGYDTDWFALGVAVSGTLAYVADGNSGLQIIDVSNPAAPVRLGGYDTSGTAYGVAVSGTLAYVADGPYGLQTLDVSDPAAPVRLGGYDTSGTAYGVAVSGTLAYVADGPYGLQTLDVSNPAAPVRLCGCYTSGSAVGLAVAGTRAYVASSSAGLEIFDRLKAVTVVDGVTVHVELGGTLPEGQYQVQVGPGIADLAGNAMDQDGDGIAAEATDDQFTASFTIDTTPPTAPVGLAVQNDTGSTRDAVTADTNVVFTWSPPTDLAGIAHYEYRLDGAGWVATPDTTITMALAERAYLLEVRAVDVLDRTGPAASLNVKVDLTPPTAPTNLHLDGAMLKWTSGADLNGIWKHQYTVDGGAWRDGGFTYTTTGLAEGTTHTFVVRAVDKAGNIGPETAATMTVDYGPHMVTHGPSGVVGPMDTIDLTFNEPLDPATVSFKNIQVTPPPPTVLCSYDTPGAAYDVAVSGTWAYVADGDSGLQILDVSNPAAPVRLGTYDTSGTAYGVTVSGTRAYVADGRSGLVVLDVSNPAAPVRLGTYDTSGTAYGVTVSGTRAYVADGASGLVIFDVSNPAAPIRLGSYDTAGTANGVALSGTRAYVADIAGGLVILDVSNPATTVRLGGYSTYGSARNVAVSGTLAYVACDIGGLQILDVSNPAAPVWLSSGGVPPGGRASDLAVSGTLAYVASSNGLHVLDVSNPTAPVWLGRYYAESGLTCGVAVSDTVAYVANGPGLQIVRVPREDHPLTVTMVDDRTVRVSLEGMSFGGSCRLSVTSGIADLAGNSLDQNADGVGDGLYNAATFIADLTPPSTPGVPQLAADTGASASDGLTASATFHWSASTDASGVAGYEYRLDAGAWVWVTDLTATPAATPGQHTFEVRAVDTLGNRGPSAARTVVVDPTAPAAPAALRLDGAALLWPAVTDAGGIWKYQWCRYAGQRPASPSWTDTTTCRLATGLADGASMTFEVRAIDMAGNVGPSAAATLSVSYGPRVVGGTVAGTVRPTDHIDLVFDKPIDPSTLSVDSVQLIPQSFSPVRLGGYDTSGVANGVTVSGARAYVADGDAGLQIIDVSNPAAPVRLGGYNTSGRAYNVTVSGTRAYVADGADGLQIIDVSNPAAPVLLGGYNTGRFTRDVTVVGTLAYVADGTAGLQILDVSNPAAPVRLGGYAWWCSSGVAVAGTRAYLTDGLGNLVILDVSNPTAPVLVGGDILHDSVRYDYMGGPAGVALSGTLVYLTDPASGLRILDVSNPALPVRVGRYATPGYANDVAVAGTLAYVADDTSGLLVLDVSNPATPMLLGAYDTPGEAFGVTVAGGRAYVADYLSGLQIIRALEPVTSLTVVNGSTVRIGVAGMLPEGQYKVHVEPTLADLAGNTMDQDGDGIGGEVPADRYASTFTVSSQPARVVGRQVFYNGSYWDGNNPAASALDDAAIAPDKQPLLPGGTATFANYTSYSRGINGVMIDVSGLLAGTPTAADFEFRIGNTNTPASWAVASLAPAISVRRGAGVGGSDRITLIFPDGTAGGQWLGVTVLSGGDIGLAGPDVFYFGNAIGEVGDQAGDAKVTVLDISAVRDNQTTYVNPPALNNPYDFNRDHSVDTLDISLVRSSQTTYANALKVITVSADSPLAAEASATRDALAAAVAVPLSPRLGAGLGAP